MATDTPVCIPSVAGQFCTLGTMTVPRARIVALSMVLAVLAASCSGSGTTPDGTASKTTVDTPANSGESADSGGGAASSSGGPGSSVPGTSTADTNEVATPTETPPIAPTPSTSTVDLSACAVGQPGPNGEVTFVSNGALLATNTTTTRCITALAVPTERVTWNPPGTAALLNSDRVLFNNGSIKPSGFLPTNTTVRWSYPTGRSLIGIAANGDLAKRDPRTLRRTVLESGMSTVFEVVYQPAGTSVTTIGDTPRADDNTVTSSGVWAMTNTGGGLTELVENQTAERVWNLRYDATGLQLYFLAEHPVGPDYPMRTYHVHRLDRSEEASGLTDVVTSTKPLDHLVVSEYGPEWAVRVGECGASNVSANNVDRNAAGDAAIDAVVIVSPFSLEPVGWLPNGRLVMEQRAKGTCDGPATLAIWHNGELTQLNVGAVTTPAIRAIRGVAQDVALSVAAPEG